MIIKTNKIHVLVLFVIFYKKFKVFNFPGYPEEF
jgi:hypothetical protein